MNAQPLASFVCWRGWSAAGLSHQPTPRGQSATQLQQAVVPLSADHREAENAVIIATENRLHDVKLGGGRFR
jgi:hypothetical protein